MAEPNNPAERERRVAVRWTSQQQASCHFATIQKITSRWAKVTDVSEMGIGLVMPCALEPGQEVMIELPCKDPTQARAVNAHIKWVQVQEAGCWSLGCVFDQPLTKAELDTLL
jgi:hypothetical protein